MAEPIASETLSAFLAKALDREAAEVRGVRRLSGGASRETFAFELFDALDGSSQRMILQRVRSGSTGNAQMGSEAALLRAAAKAGVAVAPVLAASDDRAIIGEPFLVMGWVDGETIARRILRDGEFDAARPALVGQCAASLAAIHAIPPTEVPHLLAPDPIDQLRTTMDSLGVALGQPHPAFELGFRWLDEHRPEPVPRTVVHGDFRLGNLMVGPDGLRAVLDWELAHLGDPMEDLGWLCVRAWRFGSQQPVAGVGSYDELFAAYEQASRAPVDAERVRWWVALGTLRWGVICMMQASTHLTGLGRSVEMAAIGRRVCENEYDLLALLEPRASSGVVDARTADADGEAVALHDRPRAGELIEAVREFLEGDVMAATDGRIAFHARVAARALETVERELASGRAPLARHQQRLAALGMRDDTELAAAIRAGALDDRVDEVRAEIWATVLDKVRVANPGYLLPEDQ
jgi:aminoglycoside phosphotransferase (APT) family kinase protein